MSESVLEEILGTSVHAEAIRRFVSEVATGSEPVFLSGEAGVGKELVARAAHRQSSRCDAPFLIVDCSLYYERELQREVYGYRGIGKAAKSRKGLFEFASRGTCYLARVEELGAGMQKSLLDFMRTGRFQRMGDGRELTSQVRLIASSEKNLEGFVDGGLFEDDLYHELVKNRLDLLPLRARPEDVEALVEQTIDLWARGSSLLRTPSLNPDALAALKAYPWPHNFEELRREIRHALEHDVDEITSEHLSLEVSSYWLGQQGDSAVRRVLEELDGYMREFKVLSKLDAEFGDVLLPFEPASFQHASGPRVHFGSEI